MCACLDLHTHCHPGPGESPERRGGGHCYSLKAPSVLGLLRQPGPKAGLLEKLVAGSSGRWGSYHRAGRVFLHQ